MSPRIVYIRNCSRIYMKKPVRPSLHRTCSYQTHRSCKYSSGQNRSRSKHWTETATPAASVETAVPGSFPVLARRNPTLLLRLSGALLLRFATRQFCGLLFHDPPRMTRLEPLRLPLYRMTVQNAVSESFQIRIIGQHCPIAVYRLEKKVFRYIA